MHKPFRAGHFHVAAKGSLQVFVQRLFRDLQDVLQMIKTKIWSDEIRFFRNDY